ncbi:hypothetical protein M758_9G184000 [Ceratodon purpureus]|nr:hypothetical protein M758_9G184000 [Ceratodon purpureus]
MEKLLAKYADYSQIEQIADLNTSDEAGPSRSAEDAIAGTHLASTSNISARRTPSSEGHHFSGHLQPPDESRHESFPALFRLEQHSETRLHDTREWQYTSPEKVSAAKGDIDGNMIAEFAGLSSDVYNRPSSSSQAGGANPANQAQWVANLLVECARAIAVSDSPRVKNLMWVLNELSSPYGDSDQRLAAYFLQALFCRITGTGLSCHRILTAAAEKTYSFDTLRKMILDYQEASPWTTFGHVAGNAAMMEAFEGEMKIHIVDISNTYCTQWPTLLEALATRADGTPHLRLSTIVISPEETALKVMKQIMNRLERFARLMGVPFEYSVTHQPQLEKLELAALELRQDEILAITCNQTLHHVSEIVSGGEQYSPRDILLCTFRNANPKIMVLVEDEMELVSPDFMTNFCEALRFYSLLFESIEENFPRTSNERLMLERISARNLVNMIACDPPENMERQEKGVQWDYRLRRLGLLPCPFSDDVVDDVRALLKRYKEGWGLSIDDNRLYLTWKEQVILCATAWKPIANPSPES